MKLFQQYFDVRPEEKKALVLCFCGAFLVVAYMIMARSIREALYLATFDVTTLPYINISVTILGLPTVGVFTRLLSKHSSRSLLQWTLLVTSIFLALLWFSLQSNGVTLSLKGKSIETPQLAIIAFYLATTLATIVLTSGFWVVVSERFPLRGAKRLFGLISAGGTAGAMVSGTSLSWLTQAFTVNNLIPLLVIILAFFLLAVIFLPKSIPGEGIKSIQSSQKNASIKEGLTLIYKTLHLRSLALIVMTATLASALLDYQFKELVRESISTKAGLASFFGAFYGWTGGISLLVQILVTGRLLSRFGIGWTLSVLPLILFLGSFSLLLIPGLLIVTGVRGLDNSLRKSLHRAALEVLYVPVPSLLRRKTKVFIDSILDSVAEGIGSGIIFFWVTWGGYSSRYLSLAVAGLAAYFLFRCRRMNHQYHKTLVDRLSEVEEKGLGTFHNPHPELKNNNIGDKTKLISALKDPRFEIRYQAGIQLFNFSDNGFAKHKLKLNGQVWDAARYEIKQQRPIWEMQNILKYWEEINEASQKTKEFIDSRAILSLEHTFRLFSLVLDPHPIQSSLHAIALKDQRLSSFALEYLQLTLPHDIFESLWPFIGDISAQQKKYAVRPLDAVVHDLLYAEETLVNKDIKKKLKAMFHEEHL